MRISKDKIDFFKNEIAKILPDAVIYLFGSRADDTKQGGDIDLMVISGRRLSWKEKAAIRWGYFDRYGEEKIDIITFAFNDINPFKQIILEEGLKL